ncbi:MAG: alanine dehydrogenase [Carnobacterium sp.]|uniref:Alanine dehydrogenase n=1 Tax=Carnobacterium antarcticum TaxID=2126436 RepID=A0ABW4NPA6_9LACT|nr:MULTISPECIES: alanine dehydrogenase [unclassified Carnobacterium]ALV22775.1 Alanine dehydrogenase [Carnobacterium sp. CP1]QQP70670.1 alanine dehydrogenase [Carnobacterium sp. CS13]
MKIGIPKEIKNNENRVAISPAGVYSLVEGGHEVLIEESAGNTAGFADAEYTESGAKIIKNAADVWAADMVIKVKEPLPEEFAYFREGLILFTYLHLAAAKELTETLMEKGVIGIGYETMEKDGALPLLTPMSQVAGRMAVQIGAQFLENTYGGKGILLGGTPGVSTGNVVIIGGGVSGTHAAKMAVGLGANVTILDVNPTRLAQLGNIFGNSVTTLMSNEFNIQEQVKTADLVIGAVLIPGSKAPTLVTEAMVEQMEAGSVIVDIAVDQGGIVETADKVTTHDAPVYTRHGVLHYAVANMPGAVAKTSTMALTNVTIPYALEIANKGVNKAAEENPTVYGGINVMNHKLTKKEVAQSLEMDYVEASTFFK